MSHDLIPLHWEVCQTAIQSDNRGNASSLRGGAGVPLIHYLGITVFIFSVLREYSGSSKK